MAPVNVTDGLLIIGLAIGIVILINVGIILAFIKGDKNRDAPYKALGKAIDIARNPWKEENEQLKELSNILDSIKKEAGEGENN
jgi:hypothetical protein